MDHAHARLKDIQQTIDNDEELRAVTNQLAAAEKNFRDAEQLLRESEREVEKQRTKIQQAEASLYGGLVHNPKELQDLQKDVASLKRHLDTLEERELGAMEIAENAEKDLQRLNAELDRVKATRGDQFRSLTDERAGLNKELERFSSERLAVVQSLAAQMLNVYEQLRKKRRGIAVTTVSDSACSACGTTLTPSQQQNARSTSQLFYCPSCGRILYAN
ncbi:MAG TPA: C4-type zinc ribbon domain-containing protein [Anaerolineales bacterium]|nr:C4-type zinc ribbon domain-containing protein [Anaerolineales bacterium]